MKLRECPFCGSSNTPMVGHEDWEQLIFVACFECGASGPSVQKGDWGKPQEDEDEAVKLWNTRRRGKNK